MSSLKNRKHTADVVDLDPPTRMLIAALDEEPVLTLGGFEAGPTLGTGTFGRCVGVLGRAFF